LEFAKKLLLSLISILLVAVVAEGVARFRMGPRPEVNEGRVVPSISEKSSLPGLRHVLRKSATGRQQFPSNPRGSFDADASLTYRTNSHGFRGPERPLAKAEGALRVLVLGDSFTFGRGVRYDDTFTAVAERALASEPRPVELWNLGIAGYSTVDEVALLRELGLGFGPDLAIICFFLNDTRGGPTARGFDLVSGDALPAWRRVSVLLDRLAARVQRRQQARALVARYQAAYRDDAAGWRRAREALADARELADAQGFRLALMIFPVLWDLSGPSPFAEIHVKVADAADALGIPVLDLLPRFDGYSGPELWVHETDQHANEIAHAVAAEALQEFVRELLRDAQ
jgi:lysophospholipase L1-like esterase